MERREVRQKLVRNRLTWAGHVERTGDENLEKRAEPQKMDVKRRRHSDWRLRRKRCGESERDTERTRDKYSLRLLIENLKRRKRRGKTTNGLPASVTTGISRGEQEYFHRAVQSR